MCIEASALSSDELKIFICFVAFHRANGVLEWWSTGVLGLNPSLHHSLTPILQSLIAAAANLRRASDCFQSLFAQLDFDHLIVARSFVRLQITILDGVLDRPLGSFLGKSRVHAPNTILREIIVGEVDCLRGFLGGFRDGR